MNNPDPRQSDSEDRGNFHLERPHRQIPFVGRESELDELERLLESTRDVVTIVGPPGVGKTRIAAELGERLYRKSYRTGDGVWMVSCRDLRAPIDIVRRVCRICGLSPPMGDDIDSIVESVGTELAERRQLLILDNLDEATEGGGELLDTWTEGATKCQFLTTSRQPLGLTRETTFELTPLAEQHGVEMFRRAADEFRFEPGEYDDETLRELVAQLDGLPLSLKLAAARTPVLPPADILERLDRELEVLSERAPDASRWRDSLRTSIVRSWKQLAPAERSALIQLSIFDGGFELEAAESVLDLQAYASEYTVAQVVQNLVQKSLAHREQSAEDVDRFALYSAVRSFASEKLEEIGDADAVARRRAEHFTATARDFAEALYDVPIEPHLRDFERRLPNIFGALVWALDAEPLAAAKLADALAMYNDLRATGNAGRDLFERIAGDLSSDTDESEYYAVRIDYRLVESRFRAGDFDFDEADRKFERLSERARKSGDPFTFGKALLRRVRIRKFDDQIESALELVDEALELLDDLDSSVYQLRLQSKRITLLGSLGRLEEAREAHRRAEAAADEHHDPLGRWNAHKHRWQLEFLRGNTGIARDAAERTRRIAEDIGDTRGLAYANMFEAMNALLSVRLDRALENIQIAFETAKPVASGWNLSQILTARGVVHLARREFDEAERDFDEARRIARRVGADSQVVATTLWRAILAFRRGDLSRGTSLLDSARTQGDSEHPMFPIAGGEKRIAQAARNIEEGQIREAHRELMAARTFTDRERDANSPSPSPTTEVKLAAHLLERTTETLFAEHRDAFDSIEGLLRVGRPNSNWFQIEGSEPADLSGRGPLRRLLSALVEQRLERPDEALDKADLLAAGWPDEELSPSDHAARVYQSVSELRSLGLDDILERDNRGYFLAPDVPIELVEGAVEQFSS